MTIRDRLQAELRAALQSQDWERLDQSLFELSDELGGEQPAQEYLRGEVLPCVSIQAREAFWRMTMREDQFADFIENMSMASVARLNAAGYQLGKDYSFAPGENGLRHLIVNDRARSFLAGLYEPSKFASLSIILRRSNAS